MKVSAKRCHHALLAAGIAHAETFTVADGESLLPNTETNNKFGNQITLQNGATLVLPQESKGKYEVQLVLSDNTLSLALKCFKDMTIIVR